MVERLRTVVSINPSFHPCGVGSRPAGMPYHCPSFTCGLKLINRTTIPLGPCLIFEYGHLVDSGSAPHKKQVNLGVSSDPLSLVHTGFLEVADKALETGHPTSHRGSVERWKLCVRTLLSRGQGLHPKILRGRHTIKYATLPIPKTSEEIWMPRRL